ncbi:MAG: hypothetical protein JXQ71_05820 [Verrucomicrobia bacterium]|nr:hypothetical protein [Verrucomicrobiota bacterium]
MKRSVKSIIICFPITHTGLSVSAATIAAACLGPGSLVCARGASGAERLEPPPAGRHHFDRTISRPLLENYLGRSITLEGLLNDRGDLDDNIRMLKSIGAKFIGRSLCLWSGEANLLRNLDHDAQVLMLIRSHAARHARQHLVLFDSHVPSGGLVRQGQLLMDFHSFLKCKGYLARAPRAFHEPQESSSTRESRRATAVSQARDRAPTW